MLSLAIGKIVKNKLLFLCLLMVSVFLVAMFASIPTYGDAVRQHVLQRELSDYYDENYCAPMIFTYQKALSYVGFENIDQEVRMEVSEAIGLPILSERLTLTDISYQYGLAVDNSDDLILDGKTGFTYSSDLFENIELINGRLPESGLVDGAYEVIVGDRAAWDMQYMLNSSYWLSFGGQEDPITFRVVGIFRENDNSLFGQSDFASRRSVYVTYETFMEFLEQKYKALDLLTFSAEWKFVFDHNALTIDMLPSIIEKMRIQGAVMLNQEILVNAVDRESTITSFLRILQIPNIVILLFFTVMLSGMIFENDRIEIALLYSRGAAKKHIFAMYAIQSLLLALAGLVVGIPLCLVICSVLGASNGFLDFTLRAPMSVALTRNGVVYALIGAAVFVVSMLLPILFSRSHSIVAARREKVSRIAKPFFEKYYLDAILVAVSLYMYFSYQKLREALAQANADISKLPIDPMNFLVASLFIIGFSMMITRLYPYFIRLLFYLGRAFWSPAIYASLSAARTRPRNRYIMMFIIMTVALSLYSADATRTINRNMEDNVLYDVSADITLKENWSFVDPDPHYNIDGMYLRPPDQDLIFAEPSFNKFTEMEGVELATKVYRNDCGMIWQPGKYYPSIEEVNVMAVYPDEFAQVTWWRSDMFAYHFNYMMNAMSENPYVVLLSRDLMENLGVSHGDTIEVSWQNNEHNRVACIVYDAVDFFPLYRPTDSDGNPSPLIVMNYELVASEFRIEPYEVWISVEEGYDPAEIIREMKENNRAEISRIKTKSYYAFTVGSGFSTRWVNNASAQLAAVKNDPFVLSMNSFMTLSFIVTLTVTAMGFLIFWVFDLLNRRLQIGILRSLGMPQSGVTAMLLWEQVLLSLLPMFAGFVLGGLVSSLFVSMFGIVVSGTLPFMSVRLFADALRVGVIVTGIIGFAIVLLMRMAARIKIGQILKLGED